jgi:hypothetical protein
MHDRRFDDLTRALAGGASRRGLLRGVAAGLLGTALVRVDRAAAACKRVGKPCSGDNCCAGAVCDDGVCRCEAGLTTCNGPRGAVCVADCPFNQTLSSDCRCVCATTGRPVRGKPCECDPCGGDFDRAVCGTSEITEFCIYSLTADGTCACFQPLCLFPPTPCSTSAQCPEGFACVDDECCGRSICTALCGTPIPLPIQSAGATGAGPSWR